MNAGEIFKSCLEAIQKNDFKRVEDMLTDDFTFSGPVPQPIGKHDYIELQRALVYAIPDWKFNLSNIKDMGDKASGVVRISGTHTGTLRLGMMGIPEIPPSGRLIRNPEEPLTITIKDGKISKVESIPVAGGGVEGILNQIGVKNPHHA
jgi:predicted ester cyclase